MFDQFFDVYFTYINSLLYAAVNILGLLAGLLLLRRTRNHGPFFIFSGSIIKLLVGLSFPLSNFIESHLGTDYDIMQRIWLTLSLLDLLGTIILLAGLVLIAQDFRSLLETSKVQGQIRTESQSDLP